MTEKKPPTPLRSPVETACNILGVKPDSLLKSRVTDDGGAVLILATGQKFTFTAAELAAPNVKRAQLRAAGLI